MKIDKKQLFYYRMTCPKCSVFLPKIPPPFCPRCNTQLDDPEINLLPKPLAAGTLTNLDDMYDHY